MDVPTMLSIFVSYGFETDDEMTDQRKLEALNETYADACGRETWPFLETKESFAINTSTGRATPSSSSDVGAVQAMWFTTTNPRPIQHIRLDDLNQQNPDWATTPGNPYYYYFLGTALYVAPVPAADPGDGVMAYIKRPSELTAVSAETDILIPRRYHRSILVLGTLSRLALMQDDVDMSNAYERLYEKALALAVEDTFVRQTDRTEYIHVNDQDNWDYS